MNEHTGEGHPVGPEVDDSKNPTAAAPDEAATPAGAAPAQPGGIHQQPTGTSGDSESQQASRDMLRQLQGMIDSLATQAGPVMRDVAAKAAELAALAGEKAGPLAHRAASATERVGVKVAERSKVMATELRRQAAEADAPAEPAPAAEPEEPAGAATVGEPKQE